MTLGASAGARRRTVRVDYALPTTNLSRRWRADSIAQSDNTAIATWPALVGGVDLTQATTADRPTFRTGRQNGKPAVVWPNNGGTTWLTNTTAFATLSQPLTVVAVCKPFDVTANIELFYWGAIEAYIQASKWGTWSNAALTSAGSPTANTWVVLTAVFNAGSGSGIYVNGTAVATGSSGNGALGATINLGRHQSNGQNWHGDIGEFMVYNAAADATARAGIHSYAQDYWGITCSDYLG